MKSIIPIKIILPKHYTVVLRLIPIIKMIYYIYVCHLGNFHHPVFTCHYFIIIIDIAIAMSYSIYSSANLITYICYTSKGNNLIHIFVLFQKKIGRMTNLIEINKMKVNNIQKSECL